jgi:hypothetical protein
LSSKTEWFWVLPSLLLSDLSSLTVPSLQLIMVWLFHGAKAHPYNHSVFHFQHSIPQVTQYIQHFTVIGFVEKIVLKRRLI